MAGAHLFFNTQKDEDMKIDWAYLRKG